MTILKHKMCKSIKKDLHIKHKEEYMTIISNPKYYCKKCGLVSTEKNLCKIEKIKQE